MRDKESRNVSKKRKQQTEAIVLYVSSVEVRWQQLNCSIPDLSATENAPCERRNLVLDTFHLGKDVTVVLFTVRVGG